MALQSRCLEQITIKIHEKLAAGYIKVMKLLAQRVKLHIIVDILLLLV